MEKDFVKAQSDNLPRIDAVSMFTFMQNNPDFFSTEMKGVKAQKSARETYGDKAVGYVQLKREGNICIVKGRITPEHRVTNKPYSVSLMYDEVEEEVLSVQCDDCAASLGGCKHGIAFLAWIHRRSEEPSPTSVECYWRKSILSSIGSSKKYIKAADFSKKRPHCALSPHNFLEGVVESGKKWKNNSILSKYNREEASTEKLSVHRLILNFQKKGLNSAEEFLLFSAAEMSLVSCDEAEKETRGQSNSALWHELRYGRVTASKAYEVSRCNTLDGSLVEQILGATKLKETAAMRRGSDLENSVRKVAAIKSGMKFFKCGIKLSEKDPIFGASADGVNSEFVLEIKCPSSHKTVSKYLNKSELTPKANAQIQMQMYLYKKQCGIFCVAHPDFETTSEVTLVKVKRDDEMIKKLISDCQLFWNRAIFPILMN